ncbi:putative acetyltransferase [Coprobacillus sp. CAG:698]|nr:putative acetyltransferase [Coprobacillus sp. CAG:698]
MNNITLKPFSREYTEKVVDLWNKNAACKTIYAELTIEEFKDKFYNNPNYKDEGSILAFDGDLLVGFGNAIYYLDSNPETSPAYISMIVVEESYQRHGIGTMILKSLENYLRSEGRKYIRNYFGCPINLKWYVPGYYKHEHLGAPAVPYNTPIYYLFLANNYYSDGQQDGFHIDLTKFTMPEVVVNKIKENEKDGYTITIYDEKLHHGFDEMFDALQNEGFRRTVHRVLENDRHAKIVIAQKDGEILGFTGPVKTEPTGRGSLGGVAIHPKAQKRGLGKTMFCYLCLKSKENGAKFMTLFTGSENRARNIYLHAGLKIVQSFNIMRKEL